MERFYKLIEELGEILDQKLYVDQNHACQLIFDEKLAVQIEMDASGEKILLGSFLCEIPPGRFREDVLKSSLITNCMHPLEVGTLSYVERSNQLSLFTYIYLPQLTARKLSDFIALFIEKGFRWKDAIERGMISPPGIETSTQETPPFDLKK